MRFSMLIYLIFIRCIFYCFFCFASVLLVFLFCISCVFFVLFCFVSCSFWKQEFVWFVVHSILCLSVFHCFCGFYDCFFLLFLVFSSFHSIWIFNLSRLIIISFIFGYSVFFFHLLLYIFFEVVLFFNLESRKYIHIKYNKLQIQEKKYIEWENKTTIEKNRQILHYKHTHTHKHT